MSLSGAPGVSRARPGGDAGVLSDEQIAAMSPRERRDLIRRLARPVDDIVPSHRWLRRTRELPRSR